MEDLFCMNCKIKFDTTGFSHNVNQFSTNNHHVLCSHCTSSPNLTELKSEAIQNNNFIYKCESCHNYRNCSINYMILICHHCRNRHNSIQNALKFETSFCINNCAPCNQNLCNFFFTSKITNMFNSRSKLIYNYQLNNKITSHPGRFH